MNKQQKTLLTLLGGALVAVWMIGSWVGESNEDPVLPNGLIQEPAKTTPVTQNQPVQTIRENIDIGTCIPTSVGNLEALQKELIELRQEHSELRNELKGLQSAQTDPAPAPVPSLSQEDSDDEAVPSADPNAEAAEMVLSYENVLQTEPEDEKWATKRAEEFNSFFADSELSGTHVYDMDCRTTLCRLRLTHENVEGRDAFILKFSKLAPAGGEAFAHIENESDLDVSVYVSRDGFALPM